MYEKKYNMKGDAGVLYAAGSGRKYQADDTGFIADVDHRDLGDLVGAGCTKIMNDPPKEAPANDKNFQRAAEPKAGDRLEK